jgi:hypothetical protein
MKSLIVVVVLSIFPAIHGLSCIALERQVSVPISNLNLANFVQFVDQQPVSEDQDHCRVLILINYPEQLLGIQFTKILEPNPLSVGEVQFATIITQGDNGSIRLIHALETACSTSDNCEKQFLIHHLDWILKVQYTDFFQNGVALLLGGNSSSGKCYNSLNDGWNI